MKPSITSPINGKVIKIGNSPCQLDSKMSDRNLGCGARPLTSASKLGRASMAVDCSNAGSTQPLGHWLPPRRHFVTGLLGTLVALACEPPAAAGDLDIPSFESGRYQFTILRPQRELPSIRLFRVDGQTTELSSLRDRPVLLNFWATWCAACRTELPILDRLPKQYPGLRVLAVSVDRADRTTVARFVESLRVRNLPIYWDPNGYVANSDRANERNAPFSLYGMPITYVISASGRIMGYMPGAADWSSAAARNLLDYLHRS
jgi:thiol-disulfide isomerase/thioredoxin